MSDFLMIVSKNDKTGMLLIPFWRLITPWVSIFKASKNLYDFKQALQTSVNFIDGFKIC